MTTGSTLASLALIDQTTSRVEALAIAGKLSRKNKTLRFMTWRKPNSFTNGQLTKLEESPVLTAIQGRTIIMRKDFHITNQNKTTESYLSTAYSQTPTDQEKLSKESSNYYDYKILFAISVLYIGAFGLGILFGAAAFADMVTRGIWWNLYFLFLGCSYFGWCGKTSKIQIQIGKKKIWKQNTSLP